MKRYLIAALFTLTTNCGRSEDGPVGDVDPLTTPQGLCAEWATKACTGEVLDACGSSTEDCRTTQAAFCESLLDSKNLPTPFASASVKKCLESVKKAYDDAKLDYAEYKLVRRLDGTDCANLSQKTGSGGTSGNAPIGAGLRCTGKSARSCVAGFYCDGANCVQRLEPGAICCDTTGGAVCEAELLCVESAVCMGAQGAQTCQGRGTFPTCSRDEECRDGQFCEQGRCNTILALSIFVPICEDLGTPAAVTAANNSAGASSAAAGSTGTEAGGTGGTSPDATGGTTAGSAGAEAGAAP